MVAPVRLDVFNIIDDDGQNLLFNYGVVLVLIEERIRPATERNRSQGRAVVLWTPPVVGKRGAVDAELGFTESRHRRRFRVLLILPRKTHVLSKNAAILIAALTRRRALIEADDDVHCERPVARPMKVEVLVRRAFIGRSDHRAVSPNSSDELSRRGISLRSYPLAKRFRTRTRT